VSTKPVIIIGAGCAGLSAAYELQKQGIEAVVYEASDVAGGRCRSVYEDGYQFFVGAARTEPQWTTTFEYLDELGYSNRVQNAQANRFGFPIKGKVRTAGLGGNAVQTVRSIPELVAFLATGWPPQTYIQLVKVFRALAPYMKGINVGTHNFDALREISGQSTEEFALKHGGREVVDYFFTPILATMVFGRPDEISIAHPIALFSLMQGMRSLDGGMGIITAGLYERVKDNVRLNTPVRKVVIKDGAVTGVELDDGVVEADQVICCVDAVVARQLMPDLPDSIGEALATCQYSSTDYYQFGLEKSPVRLGNPGQPDNIMFPANVDTVLSLIALNTNDEKHPVTCAATRSWGSSLEGLTDKERRRVVISEIQRFWPDFPTEPKITKVFHWDRAVNLESPGQLVAIEDLKQHHLDDVAGLYLGGEYLFIVACTEGALATGKEAAQKAAKDAAKQRRVAAAAV